MERIARLMPGANAPVPPSTDLRYMAPADEIGHSERWHRALRRTHAKGGKDERENPSRWQ
jgi:hypothetical protein